MTINVQRAFAEAIEHQKAGRGKQAEAIYREILDTQPNHPDALHLLGILALHDGRAEDAVRLIQRAVESRDGVAAFHYNLASAHASLGALDKAAISFEKAIELQPDHTGARHGLGTALFDLGRVGDAAEQLRQVAEREPRSFEAQLHLGHALAELQKLDEALACYESALELAPSSVEVLENIGLHLIEMGRPAAAIANFRKILALDPEHENARYQLRGTVSTFVPRWHFAMLNDKVRNEAYQRAIEAVVDRDSVVLDIGTGSGLLSMIAARAGARSVTTCEIVAPIAERARAVVEANGLGGRINVVNRKSTTLEVGKDLPEKASVVVFEVFDVMLLGEGVLPVIEHARATLARENATILPRGAKFFCMMVESEELWRANRVDEACEFDLSPFNLLSSPAIIAQRMNNYDYTALSAPVELFSFRFDSENIAPETKRVPVAVTRQGTCHAMACWYRLELDDNEYLDTSPLADRTHWQQGIQILDRPAVVRKGQELAINAAHNRTNIRLALDVGGDGPAAR